MTRSSRTKPQSSNTDQTRPHNELLTNSTAQQTLPVAKHNRFLNQLDNTINSDRKQENAIGKQMNDSEITQIKESVLRIDDINLNRR
ncbi:hypothetical protein F2Q70_00030417 [Brassica cretica]|uniref:Uncharacterized protein n=2 Tax=Brassica cretica TaxID=69181 RepID=A0A3N6QGF8_BRACR|nr:hypothetical protein F2Q70_00030417 [Brassica cretica]KAF2553706.1 hypothetical protein F2Q68_00034870 [Brassica cretica]KAF3596997.1 hypothetical protein DY000_02022942 [Brassica cretica]